MNNPYRFALLVCGGNAADAIELVKLMESVTKLPKSQESFLVDAWIATMSFPGDASRELSLVRKAIVELCQCWLNESKRKKRQ